MSSAAVSFQQEPRLLCLSMPSQRNALIAHGRRSYGRGLPLKTDLESDSCVSIPAIENHGSLFLGCDSSDVWEGVSKEERLGVMQVSDQHTPEASATMRIVGETWRTGGELKSRLHELESSCGFPPQQHCV